MHLLIYSTTIGSRLEYITSVLFSRIVSINYKLTADVEVFKNYPGPSLNYSKSSIKTNEFWIAADGLLAEDFLRIEKPIFAKYKSRSVAFLRQDGQSNYPFDLFALCFYLISRYEEYLPYQADAVGRFPVQESHAYQNDFLNQPLVDQWTLDLVDQLLQQFPGLQVQFPEYTYTPTYDIDLAWAFGERPWYRRLASIAKDFLKANWEKNKARWAYWSGRTKDPFQRFDYLDQLHQENGLSPIYFFLLGDLKKLDRSIDHRRPAMQALIHRLASAYESGIHPSYYSNHHPKQLRKELRRYTELTQTNAKLSRQHYLYLKFPETFRTLSEEGVKADFSLGYAVLPGFRASIARPYPWFDLIQNQSTDLELHPFAIMDVNLKRACGNTAERALSIAHQLIEETRKVNGHFYTLWHNSSFAQHEGWEGWDSIYENIIEKALAKKP